MTRYRRGARPLLAALGLVLVALSWPTDVARAEPADTPPPGVTAAVPQSPEAPGPAETPQPTPPTAAQAVTQAIAAAGHDLSPWTMFLNADILVKVVMAGLALASVLTWTILLAKSIELGLAKRTLGRALGRLAGAATLTEAGEALGRGRSVADRLVAAAADEMRISDGAAEGVKERAASRCAELVKAEGRTARRGMGALATIGAISPFVGLFGTVWGIMNSFIGISKAQTTNLAVVAPGIAEALLATAIGLAAAIPAVIVYNHFARATRAYGDLVQRASGAAMRLLSRDLDRGALRRGPVPMPRAAE